MLFFYYAPFLSVLQSVKISVRPEKLLCPQCSTPVGEDEDPMLKRNVSLSDKNNTLVLYPASDAAMQHPFNSLKTISFLHCYLISIHSNIEPPPMPKIQQFDYFVHF